jgi:hypothetical protein
MKSRKTTVTRWPLMACISLVAVASSFAAPLDTAKIDELTGLKGKMNAEERVYKVTVPRDDVKLAVAGWQMPPFMGLGTWAAFQGTNEKAMMMGDTVLFEDEVNTAMSAALDNGLSVTALHNHFFFDQPKVYFMHIGGEGSAEKLAVRSGRFTTASKRFVGGPLSRATPSTSSRSRRDRCRRRIPSPLHP